METTTSSSSGSRSRSSGSPTSLPVKTEPGLLPVKQEHPTMTAGDEAALKWAWDDYVREEMERQRPSAEEIVARRRGREEGVVVILDESDEEAPAPVRLGDPGQGAARTTLERGQQRRRRLHHLLQAPRHVEGDDDRR
ncbi:Cysteine-rich receptor-like protein kinase 10 [Hordeum vulgare]|nr:Cysteine-rich receptor-like protein kinase 10 [Hordeum vulgare]